MKAPKKIALLGFDCAITNLVRKHIDEGIAPNFKKVFENGTVAENCLVPYPTVTPPNWTAMATGAWPGTNDITDFWRHIPGTVPEGPNTHNAFNWDNVASESFWESIEQIGKKSVILNYPMAYNAHKRAKNSVVVGGGALTPGVYMDNDFIAKYKGIEMSEVEGFAQYSFSEDTLVTTDHFPGNSVQVKFSDDVDWTNVDDMGDDAMCATYQMPFANSIFNSKTTYSEWYVLLRDMGDGFDTVTLSPTKNFKDAFFTIKKGKWSDAFNAQGVLEKGGTKEIRLMAKFVHVEDDGEAFRLYLTHAINLDGEVWCNPKEKAHLLNKGNNVPTNNTGLLNLTLGWYDRDTWLEQIGIHYDWLADAHIALLGNPADWDVTYSHAHPTDYIYHAMMTDLDPETCSSKQAYEKAWELHRELYRHADRYLGRILEIFDDETLVVLISDHGATPDGPHVDLTKVMQEAGFCSMTSHAKPGEFDNVPEEARAAFENLSLRTDTSVSRAIPQRACYVYVNLKGRDPGGIVEPEDYEKVQREIIDFLSTYVEPTTGKRPFSIVLSKKDAMILGLWGDQVGDVVYAFYPEFSGQHGPILPTAEYGIGSLKPLCVYYGPEIGIKKGFSMDRVCNLVDLVPTFCYLTGWPIPKTAEGSVVYQVMEDPNFRP